MILRWLALALAAVGASSAQTPAEKSNVVARIALLSDPHTTRGTAEDQPSYRGRLDRVIAAINEERVDLVLIAGDLTQNGKAEEFDDFAAQIKNFRAPVLVTPGNHDLGPKLIPGKPEGPSAERVALFEQKVGPSYFVRVVAGVRVIGVNSPVLGSELPVETAMWRSLEAELAEPTELPSVAFLHYPPFVKTADEPGGVYWNIEPEPRARLLALLKRGGVRTVLSGHLHRPLSNRHDGLLFVSTLPVSFGLPRGKQPQGWTLVTLRRDAEALFEFRTVND